MLNENICYMNCLYPPVCVVHSDVWEGSEAQTGVLRFSRGEAQRRAL